MDAVVHDRLDGLEAAVSMLADALAGDRASAADAAVAVRLRVLLDRVDALCSTALAAHTRTGAGLAPGFFSVGSWWSQAVHAHRGEAHTRLAAHDLLDELPGFAAALAAGRVGQAHLRILTPAVTTERLELARRDEHLLTDAAEQLDPSRYRHVIRHWAALCDDELNDPTTVDTATAKRHVRLSQRTDGSWWLDAHLEPAAGEALATALDTVSGPRTSDDQRTPGQRRHDALAQLAELALRQRGDDTSGRRPDVAVIVDPATGAATTAGGVVLASWERDRLLCDCRITTVHVDTTGRPFAAGTPTTTVPAHTRRAVAIRDRRCRYPGCDRPATWCDVHHLQPRDTGGNNHIDNLALFCRRHHTLIHRHHLQIQIHPADGITITVTHPDGTTHTDRPPNPTWHRPRDRVAERTRTRTRQLARQPRAA